MAIESRRRAPRSASAAPITSPRHYAPAPPGEKLDHEPGTYDKVNSGASYIRNPQGEVEIKRGQTAFVHHDGTRPPRLLQRAPRFYQQHAEIDKRAAERRQQFHQRAEGERQRRQQERSAQREQKQQERAAKQEKRAQERQEKAQQRREKAGPHKK